jgi:serine/threonine-protein kinase CHEK1
MAMNEAQRYFSQIIAGVEYLHSRGIAHRGITEKTLFTIEYLKEWLIFFLTDLKPENILLDDNDNIKISDFGMATVFRLKGKERMLDKKCGTLPYVAPEVLLRSYFAQPADVWSCGIILTTMLAGGKVFQNKFFFLN